jgi:hypothetical protein
MRNLWIAASLLLLFAGNIQARDFRPTDFAYGIPLQTGGLDALYEFSLPDDVYRAVTRGDLGDICIFNGQGEVVPFTLPRKPDPARDATESRKLHLFPVTGNRYEDADAMSLLVKKGAGGAIISVETSDRGIKQSRITAYLLDASSLKAPLASLELEWEEQSEGTVAKLRVEGSNNLEDWAAIAPSAVLMRLRYGEHRLERRSIEMGESRMKYYRISSTTAADPPKLIAAVARLNAEETDQPRHWASLTAEPRKGQAVDYLFTMAGLMPVDRIRIQLPQENTLIQATFFSRATERDPWKPGPSALLYRLRIRGEEITSPDIILPVSSDRYRLMRIEPSGGGLGKGLPVVKLGWIPARVLFIARGESPFQLAYGSGSSGDCAHGGNTLFQRFSDQQKDRYVAGVAIPGPPSLLGGKAALRKPLLPSNGKTVVLWSLLLLGVGLLAWMALRLYRQMNNSKGGLT